MPLTWGLVFLQHFWCAPEFLCPFDVSRKHKFVGMWTGLSFCVLQTETEAPWRWGRGFRLTGISTGLLWAQRPGPSSRESHRHWWGCHLGSGQGRHAPRTMWLGPGGFWVHRGCIAKTKPCSWDLQFLSDEMRGQGRTRRRGSGHRHWKTPQTSQPVGRRPSGSEEWTWSRHQICSRSHHPELDLRVIFLTHFSMVKLWEKGFHMTITTKLQRNCPAKQQHTCDLYNNTEFYWVINRAQA